MYVQFSGCAYTSAEAGQDDGVRAFHLALDGIPACSDREELWYVLLRAAELCGPDCVGADGLALIGARYQSMQAVARRAVEMFPRSARIATVLARYDQSVDSARVAVLLGPEYVPAQVALAQALLRAEKAAEARTVLESIPFVKLRRAFGGIVALGRARLATGDAKGAAAAAGDLSLLHPCDAYEGTGRGPLATRLRAEADEISGLANLQLGSADEAVRALLRAAVDGRSTAATVLREHVREPPVRRALRSVSENPKAMERVRALARELDKQFGVPPTRMDGGDTAP